MLSKPLIAKTDGGPDCLAKEAESFEFQKEMHDRGVVILLGLPNGTSATQEMDQGYATFKPECQNSIICVTGMKLTAWVQVQKDIESKHATSESPFV